MKEKQNLEEMTLKDVQTISLEILSYIDVFCRTNHIKYSLTYGSLLGAVRHKAFIPWDDDIDIMMLREDYELFCRLWIDTDNYKLFCPQRNNCFTPLARVCEMAKTYCIPGAPMFNEQTGIWVDVFPVDYIDDNTVINNPKFHQLIKLSRSILKRRTAMYSWKRSGLDLRKQIWLLIKKILYRKDIHSLVSSYDKICKKFGNTKSQYICVLIIIFNISRRPISKSIFSYVIDVEFEGKKFQVLNGYDKYLTHIYGDYMKLPPLEKRVRGHSYQKFYWKTVSVD